MCHHRCVGQVHLVEVDITDIEQGERQSTWRQTVNGDARIGSYPAIRGQKVYVTYSQAGEAKAREVIALLKKHGEDVDAMVVEMFRLLTSRFPTEREREILGRGFAEQLAYFEADPKRADVFLKTGKAPIEKTLPPARIAAAAMVANTLMNFDECVMKR